MDSSDVYLLYHSLFDEENYLFMLILGANGAEKINTQS